MDEESIGRAIPDSAMKVHSALGSGLLESAYEACLAHELKKTGLPFEKQVILPLVYDGERLDAEYRIDLLVAEKVIVEIKAVEKFLPSSWRSALELSQSQQMQTWVSAQFQCSTYERWHQTNRQSTLNSPSFAYLRVLRVEDLRI